MATLEPMASAAILAIAVLTLLSRSASAAWFYYACAAIPQAVLCVALGVTRDLPLLFADAAVILAVKGLWAPGILRRGLRTTTFGTAAQWSPPVLLLGLSVITLLSLGLGRRMAPHHPAAAAMAVAAMVVAFGTAAVRPELWSQATGMLIGEAAITTLILVLAAGLPPIAELFALAEVVFLAVTLAAMGHLAMHAHRASDARDLRRLRG